MGKNLFNKVWDEHKVTTLPSGQDQLFIGLKGLKQHLTDLCRTRSAKRLEHLAALLNARLDGLRGDAMPTDDRTFVMLRRS